MIQPSRIVQHMEVVGDEIELTKLDPGAGLKHHMIPMSWADRVEDDIVCLNHTKGTVKETWRTKM